MALKQKTVYFREEDLPLWDKIGNKAEWLHITLANNTKPYELLAEQDKQLKKSREAFVELHDKYRKLEAQSVIYIPPEPTA